MNDLEAAPADGAFPHVEGLAVVTFAAAAARLAGEFPGIPAARIEALLVREWEAFCAGRPLVIPAAVEDGAREMLGDAG